MADRAKMPGVVRRRPAESTAAGGGLAGLAVAITSGDTVTVVVALLGFVPAAVTYLVSNGGVRGLAQRIWGAETT